MSVAIIILIITNLVLLYFSIKKYHLRQEIESTNEKLKEECNSLELQKTHIYKELQLLSDQLENQKGMIQEQIKVFESNKRESAEIRIQAYISELNRSYEQYKTNLESNKVQADKNHSEYIQMVKAEEDVLKKELDKLKESYNLTLQRIKKEQELQEQVEFFRVKITDEDRFDICVLDQVRPQLRKPEILNKLIWTTYYQKPTSAMVSNVVGDSVVCGIYKITGIDSKMVYIGQSVDIGDRFKQHIKAALGATPASANKLYTQMKKEKVENFTFEVLELCSRADLNEREKYWIGYFQSDVYGLNSTKGNS